MPLNMNTIGTGTGIGGSSSGSAGLAHSSDTIDISYNISGTSFYINNDFMYYPNISASDDNMRKYRTIGSYMSNSSSSSYKPLLGDAFWIGSRPYFWLYQLWEYSDSSDPEAYESIINNPILYMVNDDGTYTNIKLPENAEYILKNSSLYLDDGMIMIYGTSTTGSSYEINGGIWIYNLNICKFNGTTYTTIIDGKTIANYLGWVYNSSTYGKFIWNAYVSDNKLYLVVTGKQSYYYKIISVDLDTTKISTECNDLYAYPYNHSAILSGLSVVLGNTVYTIKPTQTDNGSWINQMLYYEKYSMTMSASSLTLTTVSSDLLGTANSLKDDFGIGGDYNYFMKLQSRLGNNHYLLGMGLINKAENVKESGSGTISNSAEPLYIHTNTIEVYLDDKSNVVERKVFTTPTRYSRWQKVAYIGDVRTAARCGMQYQCAFSFYIDPSSSTLGIIIGPTDSNSTRVNIFRCKPISSMISQPFNSSSTQVVTGYLYEKDHIYTSGVIRSMTCNGETTYPNKNKCVVLSSGIVSLEIQSLDNLKPVTIITDNNGSIVYFKTENLHDSEKGDQVLWSLIAGMKVNGEKISATIVDQPIDFNTYKHRIYLDMKGV